MSATFTPAPWSEPIRNDHGLQYRINDGAGEAIANVWGLNEEAEANARLIAAAPELYEAVIAMIAWDDAEKTALPYDDDGGKAFHRRMELCAEAFEKARAAAAKARGEQVTA